MNLPLFPLGMSMVLLTLAVLLPTAAMTCYLVLGRFRTPVRRRRWTLAALAILGLPVLFCLAVAISGLFGRARLERQFAELRSQKLPVTPAELAQSYEPARKAGAVDNGEHYYAAARNLMKATGLNDLAKLAERNGKNYDLPAWNPADRQTALTALNSPDCDRIFAWFRRGAAMPFAAFDHDLTKGYEMLVPELHPQRELYRLLAMKSAALAMGGDSAAAYRLLADGLQLPKQFESEPVTLTQLVSNACMLLDLDALNALLPRYGIDEESARLLQTRLAALDLRSGMIAAINGEICVNNGLLMDVVRGRERSDFAAIFGSGPTNLLGISLISSPTFYWDWNFLVGWLRRGQELFRQPYWQVRDQVAAIKSSHDFHIPRYYPVAMTLAEWIFPILKARTRIAHYESEIAAAELSLALYRYRNRHQTFPEKLDALAPEFIPEIPSDPVTGKPFEYRKTATAFQLSSAWLKEKAEQARKAAAAAKNTKSGGRS